MNTPRTVLVSHAQDDKNTILVGRLTLLHAANGGSAQFQYADTWLASPSAYSIDPSLPLQRSEMNTQRYLHLFGAFADATPDAWGKLLMQRAHITNAAARGESRSRSLENADYLLNVHDFSRQGSLRFSLPHQPDTYLAQDVTHSIPPIIQLELLMQSADRICRDESTAEDIALLLGPGSSMGGARPKASVIDEAGNLCMAKFPHHKDGYNVLAWEHIALRLAAMAGIRTANTRLIRLREQHVLLSQRFDRVANQRIPYISAQTILSAIDSGTHSYCEIAAAIRRFGSHPSEDLHELWARIALSIMVNNVDDHLRNHGFLHLSPQGWRLAPLFDVVPELAERKHGFLSTPIHLGDDIASISLLLSVSKQFALSAEQAKCLLERVSAAVCQWRDVAQEIGLDPQEITRLAPSFAGFLR